MRNAAGSTAILPYCPRARRGLPVAMPISWRGFHGVDPAEFSLKSVPALVRKRRTDPWATYFDLRQGVPEVRRG